MHVLGCGDVRLWDVRLWRGRVSWLRTAEVARHCRFALDPLASDRFNK